MCGLMKNELHQNIDELQEQGLYKTEWIIYSAEDTEIRISSGETVLNFCANNYPRQANHPEAIKAAQDAMNY